MAREIVFEETAAGIFAPAPTRSQKRAAKRDAELRRKTRQERIELALMLALFALCAGVYIWAHVMWFQAVAR